MLLQWQLLTVEAQVTIQDNIKDFEFLDDWQCTVGDADITNRCGSAHLSSIAEMNHYGVVFIH
jgi:hypothetical protein